MIKTYYEQLENIAKKKKIDLRRLVLELGINVTTYNRWKKGDRSPSMPMVNRLIKAMDKSK